MAHPHLTCAGRAPLATWCRDVGPPRGCSPPLRMSGLSKAATSMDLFLLARSVMPRKHPEPSRRKDAGAGMADRQLRALALRFPALRGISSCSCRSTQPGASWRVGHTALRRRVHIGLSFRHCRAGTDAFGSYRWAVVPAEGREPPGAGICPGRMKDGGATRRRHRLCPSRERQDGIRSRRHRRRSGRRRAPHHTPPRTPGCRHRCRFR